MNYRGIVKNGVILIVEPVTLPEGTEVRVDVPSKEAAVEPPSAPRSFLEEIGDFVGSIKDCPEDYALNHEHYRFGTPKR